MKAQPCQAEAVHSPTPILACSACSLAWTFSRTAHFDQAEARDQPCPMFAIEQHAFPGTLHEKETVHNVVSLTARLLTCLLSSFLKNRVQKAFSSMTAGTLARKALCTCGFSAKICCTPSGVTWYLTCASQPSMLAASQTFHNHQQRCHGTVTKLD